MRWQEGGSGTSGDVHSPSITRENPFGPLPRLLQSEAPGRPSSFRQTSVYGSGSLAVSKGNGEDAPVKVLESRSRSRPKTSHNPLTSEAIIAVRLEFPRS